MTPKALGWTTFGVLFAGALPFVSHPSVAPSVSSDLNPPPVIAMGGTKPACGACDRNNREEYQKMYATDTNSICTTEKPYRVIVRLATKILCETGGYWICEDTSSMMCSTYIPRPACPDDTCQYTL